MAEGKKAFVLYCDLIHTVVKLTDEQAGDLFKHILKYVNDEDPEPNNIITELTFEPVKQQLKRDLKRYEQKQTQRIEAGKRSAEARKAKDVERNPTTVESRSTNSTVIGTVIGKGKVIDTVTVISKDIENITTSPEFLQNSLIDLGETHEIILTDQPWLEIICMNNHLASIEIAKQYVSLFFRKLQNEGAARKSIADFKSHFARWLSIELQKQQKEKHGAKKTTGLTTEAEQFEFLDAIAQGILNAQPN